MFKQNTLAIIFILLISSAINAQTLTKKANDAYAKKNYKESAKLYVQALEKGEDDVVNNAYNAACSFALFGDNENGFKYLKKSIDLGYSNVSHMKRDSDLNSMHTDARWQKIIDEANARNKARKEFWESPALLTPYKKDISEDEKIAGLSKLWSEVKYNFVNFDLVPDVKWDALYVEYIPKVRETKSTFEYYKLLMEMMAKLRDGHSNVYMPGDLSKSFYGRPLFRTDLVEGKVIVTTILSDAISAKGIKIGDEITKIDNVPAKEYGEKYVMPYQSSSTKQDLIKRTYNYYLLSGDQGKSIKLSLTDKKGKSFETEVQRYYGIQMRKLVTQAPSRPFEFELLANNIAYVSLNSFGNNEAAEEFEKNFDAIAKTAALIIDVRRNGGGNSNVGWYVLSMLTDKNFRTSKWHTREYRPVFRAWGRPEGKYGNDAGNFSAHKSKYYDKPVVVLTSPATFSAAEDFAVAFDVLERGLIIGEATGGSTGQPLFFRLPGGGSARVTSKRDSYPDGKEFVGVGIQPDKLVQQTVKDIRSGRDTVLEAARAELTRVAKK